MPGKAPDSNDAIVGRNIRLQRHARHMSMTELGGRLGVSYQQVQKYEKGMNRVGSGRLARIAEIFGMPIEALFDGATDSRQGVHRTSPLDLIAEKEPFQLVEAFAQIKNRGLRRSIVNLVERIAAGDERGGW